MGTKILRRYTNLAAALDVLRKRHVALLNPSSWDDKNDAFFLSQYKEKKGAKTVLALCFTETKEKYHHWRIFAYGTDGVCIEFDKPSLLEAISQKQGSLSEGEILVSKRVKYLLIDVADETGIATNDLPFRKRSPYKDDVEFRVLYANMHQVHESMGIPISLPCVRRVTLSPWMSSALVESVRRAIKGINGCAQIKVYQSTLIENERWKKIAIEAS